MKKSRRSVILLISFLFNFLAGGATIPIESSNKKIKANYLSLPSFYGFREDDNEELDPNQLAKEWRKQSRYELDEDSIQKINELMSQAEFMAFRKHNPVSPQHISALSKVAEYADMDPRSKSAQMAEDIPAMEQKVVVIQTLAEPQKMEQDTESVKEKQEPSASKMIMEEENLKEPQLPKEVDSKKIERLQKLILLNEKTKFLRKELENNLKNNDRDSLLAKLSPSMAVSLHQNEDAWTQLKNKQSTSLTQIYLLAVIAGCSVAAFACFIVAGVCWYRHKKANKTTKGEFPGYGITGPNLKEKSSPGDRKLAQNAQMYHYQHQKQQMIASERVPADANGAASDGESEEENEEGDFTVFECPGLAVNGEMEVQNPMFKDAAGVQASHESTNKK